MTIELEKKSKVVSIVLEKRGMKTAPTCQVSFACDISGSMDGLFRRGVVQETVNRLLAIANRFDDNGEMEVWAFNTSSKELPPAKPEHFDNYVNGVMLRHVSVNGGTNYAPVMKDIIKNYFYETKAVTAKPAGFLSRLFGSSESSQTKEVKKQDAGDPVVNYFITDGDNNDESSTEAVIKESLGYNIYWMLMGIGTDASFRFIRDMADKYPNVGFVHLKDLSTLSDEALFNSLITTEFCEWVNK